MKNTTKKRVISALSFGLSITVVGTMGLAFMGCPTEQEEQTPVSRSENITLAAGKTMTVHFTALPSATPAWWSKLSLFLQSIELDFPAGTYILTVTPDGTGSFVAGAAGTKTATVGENWLYGADNSDMLSIFGILDAWVAQVKNQNQVRYAGGMSPFELAQVKKYGYACS